MTTIIHIVLLPSSDRLDVKMAAELRDDVWKLIKPYIPLDKTPPFTNEELVIISLVLEWRGPVTQDQVVKRIARTFDYYNQLALAVAFSTDPNMHHPCQSARNFNQEREFEAFRLKIYQVLNQFDMPITSANDGTDQRWTVSPEAARHVSPPESCRR